MMIIKRKIYLIKNATNNRVLSLKLSLPIIKNSDLFLREAIERGSDIFVVLAHLCEGSASIFSGKHGVGTTGAVEGFAGGDVEDAALNGDVDGLGWIGAVELGELVGCKLCCH
ncbi:hypothetical protein TanjilG_07845 [Lupinus angustifolius]|uniref:Uncharacterized protein n=1 Tax=Lupinus angustifolius TaxID=3871 RepID=A0A1J7G7L1_LUPAN|nr:hypothetical protein TanjilG_07845 [Lupinus angustifolius]